MSNYFGLSYRQNIAEDKLPSEGWLIKKRVGKGRYSVYLEEYRKGPTVLATRALNIEIEEAKRAKNWEREVDIITEFSKKKYDDLFVKSFEWFQDHMNVYIAMEYLPHGSLQHHLRAIEPQTISEWETRAICSQLVRGLVFMHDNGIAHRDIKPDNILIKAKPQPPDSTKWLVKLGDFGFSKRIEATQGDYSSWKGTPGFTAPEVDDAAAQKIALNDARPADMWALGEVLSRMLTGGPAFPAPRRTFYDYFYGKGGLPTQTLRDKRVSENAIRFYSRLMRRLPEERPTAQEASSHAWLKDPEQFFDTDSLIESWGYGVSSSGAHPPVDNIPQTLLLPEDDWSATPLTTSKHHFDREAYSSTRGDRRARGPTKTITIDTAYPGGANQHEAHNSPDPIKRPKRPSPSQKSRKLVTRKSFSRATLNNGDEYSPVRRPENPRQNSNAPATYDGPPPRESKRMSRSSTPRLSRRDQTYPSDLRQYPESNQESLGGYHFPQYLGSPLVRPLEPFPDRFNGSRGK
ncbi:hypothetical protein TWF696_005576 [Orbilia brochopaga]|uniref:Autophagy-related protein 1 n=1 Tax=Orbilia brochopaga TaxID=3140254 RepID=A0AAV9V1J7_9PEZI